jgi:FlgD Ig-like domain
MFEAPTRSRSTWIFATRKLLVGLAAFAALASASSAHAVVRNVPGTYPTIAAGLAAAGPNDVVLVAPGTYVITSTLVANTSDVTLQGSGVGSTTMQVASSVGNMLQVNAANFTLRDFTVQKTDLPNQGLILILGSGCTVRDNEIYGPDPGTPWSVNGIVSRAMEIGGGASGLLIQNNNIHHLRQPAYINGPTVGTITSNVVSGTRGWVIDGASITFTGNSWGPPQNQGADIALLASCTAVQYPNLLALSSGNGNAYISGQFAGAASGRADGYSDDSAAPGGNGSVPTPYLTVQEGVNGTLPGGTLHVADGTYTEQVIIAGKNLAVLGAGAGSTIIQAPAALATTFSTNKPVITADGAANVVIQDLKVDGMGNGNANNRLVGIAYWNAGGLVSNVAITRVRNTPLDGAQAGVGLVSSNNTGGPYTLGVSGVVITDFQKNGMTLAGVGMTATVTAGAIIGAGNTALIAQNGIQVSNGAGGSINGTAISGLRYTPATTVSVGLLVFGPGGSVAASNLTGSSRFVSVQVPVYFIDASGSVNGAEVDATSSDQGAIFCYNTSLSALKAKSTSSRSGAPQASPDEDGVQASTIAKGGMSTNSSLTFAVSNACLSGSNTANTQGVGIFSDGGPVAATVNNCTIANWDQGIYMGGAAASVVANDNSITGNSSAGFDNTTSLAAQNAERNWWGSATGPSGTGPGSGDAVLGANVDFNPWRTSGVDNSLACGFQPDSNNPVSIGPAPGCLTGPCIVIPVSLNRSDSANLRGYSVDIQLSANLILCTTPAASITKGPYLATGSGLNGTQFQVVSNGGGSYTVDEAILGLPCGATGSGGNIFNISVKPAAGGDGTGTITVTAVLLRDCDNAPIPSSIGAPVNITIDQTPPAAIAALTATQVKTGNDVDGTTKITIAWPAVEAGATVAVYRAKFGNYPEYDDPPTPGSPPNAATAPGAPWVLTSVTVSGTTDEVASPDRDFWYYVAFVKDACNNVSTVSNRTNGTLNYHLGDVSNGITAGQGINVVDTADMSLLGANYGIFGAPVAAVAYLDVGPTTDFSVNARPTTDDRVNFEDLIMFAINYGTVSAPGMIADRPSAGVDALTVETSGSVGVGEILSAKVHLSGSGRIQGLSTQLSWNPRAVTPIGFEAGSMVTNANGVVYSPAPGTVDAALLGVRDQGLVGEGDIATVRFRVLAAIDPEIAIASVTARDAQNQPVSLGASDDTQDALPKATLLLAPTPNPTARVSTLAFSLAQPGRVNLAIYSVDGRKVRTLMAEDREAGFHSVSWNGTGDDGQRVGAGIYFARMITADGGKQSRVVTLLGH